MRTIPLAPKEKEELLRSDTQRLSDLVVAVGRRSCLRDPVHLLMERMQFTAPQVHAIMWLGIDGPLSMGEVARRGGMTVKTITGVVHRLERAGLVERERRDDDRRVIHVRLTRKGLATHRRLRGHMFLQMQRFLSLLDDEDRQALFRILGKIRDRIVQLGRAEEGRR